MTKVGLIRQLEGLLDDTEIHRSKERNASSNM